eukprot:CAMPEP_0170554262 /NCGR_PEP_ID=MMETSP0211-20121228/12135_1 /TAXON_ID=311385 /ORGANISM="Pseudokeronopsis sp., Strain OXSARD2" /LENGTH=164 /DNA_ID=CAMNT_0010863207 /DNA_START=306 /DNA_END=800 /DNA_ORIENTATION=+
MESLLKAKPNSKEMSILKFYKEAKERAETLQRINKELDKKMTSVNNKLEKVKKEKSNQERKYNVSFRALDQKIDIKSQEMENGEEKFEKELKEVKANKSQALEKQMNQQYEQLHLESDVIFKLKENTNANIDIIQKIYDFRDRGKRDAEHQYKTELMYKHRDFK